MLRGLRALRSQRYRRSILPSRPTLSTVGLPVGTGAEIFAVCFIVKLDGTSGLQECGLLLVESVR